MQPSQLTERSNQSLGRHFAGLISRIWTGACYQFSIMITGAITTSCRR